MRDVEEIIIHKATLGVLDKENNSVILPTQEIELAEDIYEYFEKHIIRGMRDEEAKPALFDGERNVVRDLCKEIFEDPDSFLQGSQRLVQYLYKCMGNEDKEPSGDAAVCFYEGQEGKYIAILKLNYTNAYCHYIKEGEGATVMSIGINRTGLPGIGQRIAKSVFIKEVKETREPGEYDLLIVDKQPDGYFTQAFVKCGSVRDRRENTKIIHKASENFARKAFKDNAQEAESFRNKLTEFLKREEKVDIEQIAEETFKDNTALKNEYKATMVSEGIKETEVPIDREWAEKKLKRKRLKVDKSIELYIDMEVYHDKEKFQIKRNGDGTIDIILKNIKNYIEK